MTWPIVKLGELVDIKGGGTPDKNTNEYWGGDIPWASVKDFKSSEISSTIDSITILGVKKSATNIIPAGNIIIPSRMALGKVAINLIDIAINQDLKALFVRDINIVDKRYLLRWLESQSRYIESEGKGATVKGITLPFINSLNVPLPPIHIQKKIAATLDKINTIRHKRAQSIKLADDFIRATFLDMFGDPVENPKGWKTQKIKKGVLKIISGWSATGENVPCNSDELGVLKISAVTSGVFKPEENKVVNAENIHASKKLIHPKSGDLLFSRANTRELVAAICMVHQDYDNIFLPDKLWSIKLNHELLLPEFFLILIQNDKVRELLTKQATGTSGSMLNISKGKFEETEIIYPDLHIQQKFCNVFRAITNWKKKSIESHYSINNLINSITYMAFGS